ncbi:hypothetical protein ACFLYV_03255, partial [Chloroflexota bacterium]
MLLSYYQVKSGTLTLQPHLYSSQPKNGAKTLKPAFWEINQQKLPASQANGRLSRKMHMHIFGYYKA